MVNAHHLAILKRCRFKKEGTIAELLKSTSYEDERVIYAITDPGSQRVVYVGETEVSRDLKGRLKAHLRDRAKVGLVELDSVVWVHFMVTEEVVLFGFEEVTGERPELNRRRGK